MNILPRPETHQKPMSIVQYPVQLFKFISIGHKLSDSIIESLSNDLDRYIRMLAMLTIDPSIGQCLRKRSGHRCSGCVPRERVAHMRTPTRISHTLSSQIYGRRSVSVITAVPCAVYAVGSLLPAKLRFNKSVVDAARSVAKRGSIFSH